MTQLPVCAHCGDRIGVYEPTVVVTQDGIRITSLAREPSISDDPAASLFHARCAATGNLRRRR